MFDNEEEKKKREEEAKAIINSMSTTNFSDVLNNVNYANQNNIKINIQNDEEQKLIDKINEGNNIINSINPRLNVKTPEPTEEELQKSRETTARLINLMDNGVQTPEQEQQQNVQQTKQTGNYGKRLNQTKSKEELDQQIKQASVQGVKETTENQDTKTSDVKISLASPEETENAKVLDPIDVKAMEEAEQKNENIEKGGVDKFNEGISTVLSNIYGGAKQTIGGLVNIVTTGVGFGLKGLSGAAKIVGLQEQGESLDEAYDSVVGFGSDINKTASYEQTVTSQIEDDTIRTSGQVTNTISNMLSSYVIGYVAPVSSTAVMGLSAGGTSAQEVLDENKDNITQATLTGIAKGYTSYLTEKMFDANILTRGAKKSSVQNAINRLIANKISSDFGKEFANKSVGIIGENIEEIADNNLGYLIDHFINDKDMPDFKNWLDEQSETVKLTTLSTIVMSMLGLGGTSFKEIEGDLEAEYWIDQAEQFIEQEDLAIHFNPSEVQNLENTKNFYITRFTPEGEIANIVETKGKPIYNPNKDINIEPVVVKDSNTDMYNVIDGNTGVILDSTPYYTTMEAEAGFNEKVNKLSDLQVKDINSKISQAEYMITDEIMNTVNEAQEQLNQMQPIDYGIQETDMQNITTNADDNQTQSNLGVQTINNISENPNAVKMEDRTIENISDKNVKSYQSDFPEIAPEIQEMAYNFQEDLANTLPGERYKAGDEWTGQKRSTTKELAQIKDSTGASWEKIGKALEDISNGEGDYALAKKVELVLDEALTEGYTNIYGQTIMPNESYIEKKGRIEGKDYTKVETEYNPDENVNEEDWRIFGERKVKDNVRAEKIRYENNGQKANRTETGKNTRGEKEVQRTNEVDRERVQNKLKEYEKAQKAKQGKDFKAKLAKEENLTRTEKVISKEFKDITGLDYTFYETNKATTQSAFYMDNDIFGKHNVLNSKKKSNFLPYHELGHWLKINKTESWNKIHDIIDNTLTKEQIEKYKNVLNDKSVFDNMTENEIREYIIEEIESDYIGNWANDIYNWADIIRSGKLSKDYIQLLIDISEQNTSTHYNIFGTEEQQNEVYAEISNIMKDILNVEQVVDTVNKTVETVDNVVDNSNKSVETVDKPVDNIKMSNRKDIITNENKVKTVYRKFSKDFQNKGYIDFNNKKINNIEEVADISQVFRNPNYETFRVIYTKGNTIVGQEAISSKIPNNTRVFLSEDNSKNYFKMKDRMKRLNADGYYMVHNHPSGVAVLSKMDIETTKKFKSNVQGFKGHVVVNSGTYAYIDTDGNYQNELKIKDYKADEIDKMLSTEPWTKIKLNTPDQIAKIMYDVKNNPNYSTLILTDSQLYGRIVLDVPNNFFNMRAEQIEGYIRNIAKKNGAERAFLATINEDTWNNAKKVRNITDSILYNTEQNDLYVVKNLAKENEKVGSKIFEVGKEVKAMRVGEETEINRDNKGNILSKEQQEYFKDSKIRDKEGNLKVIYHTSKNNFTVFDPTKTEHYRFGKNIVNYYTDNKNMSLSYSLENPNLYQGYLNIKNPYIINAHGAEWNKVNRTIDKTLLDKINKIDSSLKQEIINKAQEINLERKRIWNDYQNEVDKIYSLKSKITPDDKFYRIDELENLINKKSSSQRTDNEKEYLTLRKRSEQLYLNYNNYNEIDEFYKYFKNNKEFNNVINSLMYKKENELKIISRNEFYEIAKLGFNQENIVDRFGYYETTNDIVFNVLKENKSRKQKYDGVIIKNVVDYGNYSTYDGEGDVFVTFNSNQFKNIDNKKPTENEDIRYINRQLNEEENTPYDERIQEKNKAFIEEYKNNIYRDILMSTPNEQGSTNAQGANRWIEQEIQKVEETGDWDNSIPITKLTDIRKTIEDYLGIGLKKGGFRQRVYGLYKPDRDIIRVKEYKDIDNILHEAGHAIDLGKRLNVDKESIASELFTAVDRHGGYEQETREVRLEEGFAEIIREYGIVPKQAKADYPQTVAVLEKLRQNDKGFNRFIEKVQEQTYNYIHQNPRNRTLSNISIGERTDKPQMSKEYIAQEVMRNVYDKDWTLKKAVNEIEKMSGKKARASENAYYLTRLVSGIGQKTTSMLANGYIDENGNKLMPGLSSLGEILGNDPQRFNDLRAYLVAQRDLEYKAKTLKTGIRTMDTKAVVEQFKNDTQIQEAAKVVYDTLDGVLQYAVNNGLITEENADSLRSSNVFYVPMQRNLDGRNNVGRKGAVTDIIKARTGSELDIKDVLENIISNSSNIIQQVENNNVLKALYKQGEQAGMTGKIYDVISTPMTKIGTAKLSTWENELKKQGVDTKNIDFEKTIDLFAPNNKVDANNLITSFINEDGKRVYLQFNDEVLFNSLMNMDKKFMSRILNFNRKLNMPLRYGATMANIGFAIPNMISDTTQAAIFSEAGFIPVVDNLIGVMDILSAQNKTARQFFNKVVPGYADRINTMYALYEQSGATSSTRLSQYRESTQVLMKDVYGTKNNEVLGIKEKYKPLKRLLDVLTYIPELSEQSTRFRVFEKNLNYYRRTGLEETDARIKAALQSRDATQDFGRTGNVTREINQLIPFSAARVGSVYTFAEKAKANPKQVTMRMSVLAAIAMAIKAIGYDDKEIEELNQTKKDDNFVLKLGDNVVTIKKPQGILRSIINFTEYIQDLFTGNIEEGKEGERLVELLKKTIMDNAPADSVTGLVPNMIAPVVENAINKDLYYNSDIVKSYDLDLPDSEQYYDYNSQLAIWLGKIFNYSPAKIDNLISGYFAGLGTSVTNIIDWISGKLGVSAEQPEMGAEDNAVAKRFIVNVNSHSSSVDEIYTVQTDLTKKKNGKTITPEEKEQLESVENAISEITKINKQIKDIKKDLTKSGQEKADEIKLLQEQKVDTARVALGKETIYENTEERMESTVFYPSRSSLSKNNYSLELTPEMKKEYEELAYNKFKQYEQQGLYNDEYIDKLKEKSKEYAKNELMKKYKDELVKKE